MTDAARLCVVRHGETDWNAQGIMQGWTDVPLNETGRNQSREVGERLAGARIGAVWSSPLQRSRETAEIIATVLGLPPPILHEGLKERSFGSVQGMHKTELARHNPALLQQVHQRNPAAYFEGGEAMDEFADRVVSALLDIGARHGGEHVLVVTHGWVMDVITRHVAGLPRNALLNLKRKNGEAIRLAVTASRAIVEPES